MIKMVPCSPLKEKKEKKRSIYRCIKVEMTPRMMMTGDEPEEETCEYMTFLLHCGLVVYLI